MNIKPGSPFSRGLVLHLDRIETRPPVHSLVYRGRLWLDGELRTEVVENSAGAVFIALGPALRELVEEGVRDVLITEAMRRGLS